MSSFLAAPSPKRIRKEIQNICDSYSHPWDVLAELSQNSVDAILRWNLQNPGQTRDHFIKIEIDRRNRGVAFQDSGSGINPDIMPGLLAPNETDKEDEEESVGKKGVGLKYAIFSSNLFRIETASATGTYSGTIRNALSWRLSNDNDPAHLPNVEDETSARRAITPPNTGTTIHLEGIDSLSNDIFTLSVERLVYLLRTKTAIGDTRKKLRNVDLRIRVELKVVDLEGRPSATQVLFEYAFPEGSVETL